MDFQVIRVHCVQLFCATCLCLKNSLLQPELFCALMVDSGRLFVYAKMDQSFIFSNVQWKLVLPAIAAAWTGAWIGNNYLHKVTLESNSELLVFVFLIFGTALGMGLIWLNVPMVENIQFFRIKSLQHFRIAGLPNRLQILFYRLFLTFAPLQNCNIVLIL